jgi:hypothetical protein
MVATLEERIAHLELRVGALEEAISSNKPSSGRVKKAVSLSEWVRSKKPRSSVETVVVIGAYLERFRRTASFTQNDLKAGFREAKEPLPGNLGETINKSIRKSHVAELQEKKNGLRLLMVTNSGETFVDGLPIART